MRSRLGSLPLDGEANDAPLAQVVPLKLYSHAASFAVILLGCFGLIGWMLKAEFLQSAFHGLPSIMPSVAMALMLAGFSLWLQREDKTGTVGRRIAQGMALAVTVMGALTISEHLFQWEAGIHQFLFKERLSQLQTPTPGRPAFLTALSFFFLGSALLFLDLQSRWTRRIVELLTVTAILISLLALIGYAYNVPLFYGWNSLFSGGGMALLTVVAFTVLGTGILCARADRGLMRIYTSPTASGMMARRLLLAPVAIPLLTGGVKVLGQHFGIYNAEVAGWLMAFSNILIFTLAIWWSAHLLYGAELVRVRAEEDLNKLNAELEHRVQERTTELSRAMATVQENEERVRLTLDRALDAVITMDSGGRVTSWNREAEKTFGWTRQEMIERKLSETIIPPGYREAHERGLKHFLATQEGPVLNKRIEITALHRDGREFPVELAITPIRMADNLFFSAFIRDITGRKQSEAAAGQLAAIVESSDDAIIGKDLDGVITSWNKGAERIFGYTASEMIGISIMRLIPADRQNEEIQLLKQIRLGNKVEHFETLRQTKHGQLIDISVTASPIKDAHGQVIGVSKVARNISGRKQAEEALRESEERFRAFVTTSSDVVYRMSPDWSELRHLHGRNFIVDTEKPSNAWLQEYIHPDDQAHVMAVINEAIRTTSIFELEHRVRRVDGTFGWTLSRAIPLPDAKGEIVEWFGTASDVTERKRAEEELRQSQARFSAVFRSAPVAMSMNIVADGRLLEANEQYCEFFGYAREEIIGRSVLDLNLWANPEERAPIIQRLLQEGSVRSFEVRQRRKSGEVRDVLASLELIELAGESEPVLISMFMDITERKQAEEKICNLNTELEQRVVVRTAELQTANEELEAFSYSVSHDLRAPLRHVLGYINLLQKEAGPTLSEKSLRHVATISQAGKRMGNLIDDLLAFSRIGKSQLKKTEVNLEQLVQETRSDFQGETKERNIIWEIRPMPPVQADRALLRLVLVNLISNAVKFTSGRKQPQIEIGCAANHNGETVIFIRDNGAGFDPQYIDKLFGVFQRLHGADEFEGTGIGLANVRRIIHRHGGKTWAEGIVDGGATFYFSIPKQTIEA